MLSPDDILINSTKTLRWISCQLCHNQADQFTVILQVQLSKAFWEKNSCYPLCEPTISRPSLLTVCEASKWNQERYTQAHQLDFKRQHSYKKLTLLKTSTSQGSSIAPCCSTSPSHNCPSLVSAEKAIKQMGSYSVGKKTEWEKQASVQPDNPGLLVKVYVRQPRLWLLTNICLWHSAPTFWRALLACYKAVVQALSTVQTYCCGGLLKTWGEKKKEIVPSSESCHWPECQEQAPQQITCFCKSSVRHR